MNGRAADIKMAPAAAARPRNSGGERNETSKSVWSWLFTMLLFGLIALLGGIFLGGVIST